jgi:hypothetical protein
MLKAVVDQRGYQEDFGERKSNSTQNYYCLSFECERSRDRHWFDFGAINVQFHWISVRILLELFDDIGLRLQIPLLFPSRIPYTTSFRILGSGIDFVMKSAPLSQALKR